MALMGLGMALVVSPLSTAIMTAVEDKDTGAASGINNAVSRIGGLIAVAAMGSLAAWVYATMLGNSAGPACRALANRRRPGFAPELDATRLAASDAAFATVAGHRSCFACFRQLSPGRPFPGERLPWPRRADDCAK